MSDTESTATEKATPRRRGLVVVGVIALTIIITRLLVWTPYVVMSGSMEPTLEVGSYLIGQHAAINPARGDIVVFKIDGDDRDLIKRVVAVTGDVIDIVDGRLWVNGEPAADEHAQGTTKTLDCLPEHVSFPYIVPDDSVFIMGDNREHSLDSRSFGAVPITNIDSVIVGTVPFITLPVQQRREI